MVQIKFKQNSIETSHSATQIDLAAPTLTNINRDEFYSPQKKEILSVMTTKVLKKALICFFF